MYIFKTFGLVNYAKSKFIRLQDNVIVGTWFGGFGLECLS